MKVEKLTFVNSRRFKEYAVRFKRNILARWQWVKDGKGNNMIFTSSEIDAVISDILGKGSGNQKESSKTEK